MTTTDNEMIATRTEGGARVPVRFDNDLWNRLEAMAIDPPGSTTTFQSRLREYNGWSLEFCGKVDREYRRFLYLAATCGHAVTPSGIIDQAWHLHLIYTRHYWDELCGKILGKPLHHEPSRGGATENSTFNGQYLSTLESYQRHFGEKPPADVWPAPTAKRSTRIGGHAAGAVAAFGISMAFLPGLMTVFVAIFFVCWIVVAAAADQGAMNRKRGEGGCGAAGSGGHHASGGGCGSGSVGCGGGGCGGGCGG